MTNILEEPFTGGTSVYHFPGPTIILVICRMLATRVTDNGEDTLFLHKVPSHQEVFCLSQYGGPRQIHKM